VGFLMWGANPHPHHETAGVAVVPILAGYLSRGGFAAVYK